MLFLRFFYVVLGLLSITNSGCSITKGSEERRTYNVSVTIHNADGRVDWSNPLDVTAKRDMTSDATAKQTVNPATDLALSNAAQGATASLATDAARLMLEKIANALQTDNSKDTVTPTPVPSEPSKPSEPEVTPDDGVTPPQPSPTMTKMETHSMSPASTPYRTYAWLSKNGSQYKNPLKLVFKDCGEITVDPGKDYTPDGNSGTTYLSGIGRTGSEANMACPGSCASVGYIDDKHCQPSAVEVWN